MMTGQSPEHVRTWQEWQTANAVTAKRSERHARIIGVAAALLTLTLLIAALWGR